MSISIISQFDQTPDRGFVRAYDSHVARRQFRISVALILILTMAAFTFGFMARPNDAPSIPNTQTPSVHKSLFAQVRTNVQT